MAVLVKDSNEHRFFKELDDLPDRFVGLLAPVIVENRLTSAIQARLCDFPTSGGSLFSDLFREGGELGNFATKARLGLALGLYSPESLADLRAIMKVRNAFAHKLEVEDFDSPLIRDFVSNIKIVEKYKSSNLNLEGLAYQDAMWQTLLVGTLHEDLTNRRTRFLRAIELFSSLFLREEQETDQKPAPPRF